MIFRALALGLLLVSPVAAQAPATGTAPGAPATNPATTAPAAAAPATQAAAAAPAKAPFPYVWGEAFHVLPETHNNESGYLSLVEGQDGTIYVGTAKYGENGYLVGFDPPTGRQRIVIDANAATGSTGKGFAAQAKIHTKNFVGPSGKIYAGTKQGYPTEEEKNAGARYPGGYVVIYDPRIGKVESLGMPYPGEGVIDAAADEARNLIYVVTCEDGHWMLYEGNNAKAGGFGMPSKYRELGPTPSRYASTLLDDRGMASILTDDFRLAQYEPARGELTVRDILVDGKKLAKHSDASIPLWTLGRDGRSAFFMQLDDPTLLRIDLRGHGPTVSATSLGKLIEGEHPDARGGLSQGPDGKVYTVVRIDNATGFGKGFLHHLVRCDPATKKIEDLGVLAVKNRDFFDFAPGSDGKPRPWSHGYHELPDGTLTPLYHHNGFEVARDGTIYVTILYPFTLLKITDYRQPPPAETAATPSRRYADAAGRACDATEARMAEITRVAEVVAKRHLAGGAIGFPWNYQSLQQDLYGRAGGLIHIGFDRVWKSNRTKEEEANDVGIIGWDRPPGKGELDTLKAFKARGGYLIGFGPKDMPELAEHLKLCDAFFDTGFGPEGKVLQLADGTPAGRINPFANAINGWAFIAELVGALTRAGKMPTMWMAYSYPEGLAWGQKYLGRQQFHDDLTVPLVPPGELGRRFVAQARYHVRAFRNTQLAEVERAGRLIAEEFAQGRQTVVAAASHMPWTYVAVDEDKQWAVRSDLHHTVEGQMEAHRLNTPDGALVLRLDYCGYHYTEAEMFARKHQRVLLITPPHPDPDFNATQNLPVQISTIGAYGDACVSLEGYPLRIIPHSGFTQVLGYECVDVEVQDRIARAKTRPSGTPGSAPAATRAASDP